MMVARSLSQQPWIVIGVYCAGIGEDHAATRHAPVPVMNYRRAELDDGRWWIPIYSSNDDPEPLDNQRAWLDLNDHAETHRSGPDDRAHDTFVCRQCGFSLRVRWDEIERALDNAYSVPVPRILLHQWRIRRAPQMKRRDQPRR